MELTLHSIAKLLLAVELAVQALMTMVLLVVLAVERQLQQARAELPQADKAMLVVARIAQVVVAVAVELAQQVTALCPLATYLVMAAMVRNGTMEHTTLVVAAAAILKAEAQLQAVVLVAAEMGPTMELVRLEQPILVVAVAVATTTTTVHLEAQEL